jgi:hypothetical protein
MAMTVREAYEEGTDTFNAHDIDRFTGVLADDVVFRAPLPRRQARLVQPAV